MENLNGRKLVEAGELCERRNGVVSYFFVFQHYTWGLELCELLMVDYVAGRGVDLNRNWSVDWGKKEKVCYAFIFL